MTDNAHLIAPEELLLLPTNHKSSRVSRPLRNDLLFAVKCRRDAVSSREKRRRRQASDRSTFEVLGSMLARSAQNSRNYKEGGTPVVDGRHNQLTLLRADRTTPVVQPLYRAEEAGLGQARAEDAGGSELDSGVSEWASGDERENAAFEALIKEEARVHRRRWSRPPSIPTTSGGSESDDLPCRCRRSTRLSRRQSIPSNGVAAIEPAETHKMRESPPSVRIAAEDRKHIVEAPSLDQSRLVHPATTSVPPETPNVVKEEPPQIWEASSANTAETRSEGVQCSSPPVDKGVQTSALVLPRKGTYPRDRTLHPRSITTPRETLAQENLGRNNDNCRIQTTSTEAVKTHAAGEGGGMAGLVVRSRSPPTDDIGHAGDEVVEAAAEGAAGGRGGASAAAGRMHVQVGNSPVIMVQLQPQKGGGATDCGDGPLLKRFLWVTDFGNTDGFVAAGDDAREGEEDTTRHSPSSQFQGTRIIRMEAGDSGVTTASEEGRAGGRISGGRDNEEQDGEWRRNRLDPLWDGLGSLKERLAGVDDLFDELEHGMNHDRQVVEFLHQRAREELDAAAKEQRDMRAHQLERQSRPSRAPLWLSRSDGATGGANVFVHEGTEAICIEQKKVTKPIGIGDGKDIDCGAGQGSSSAAAEEELREARALLMSIEHHLTGDTNESNFPGDNAATSLPTGKLSFPPSSLPGTAERAITPNTETRMSEKTDGDLDADRLSLKDIRPSRRESSFRKLTLSLGMTRPSPSTSRQQHGCSRSRASSRRPAPKQGDDSNVLQKHRNHDHNNNNNNITGPLHSGRRQPGLEGATRSLVTLQLTGRQSIRVGNTDDMSNRGGASRSVGTIVAHFPTAVIAARAKRRGKARTREGRRRQ